MKEDILYHAQVQEVSDFMDTYCLPPPKLRKIGREIRKPKYREINLTVPYF